MLPQGSLSTVGRTYTLINCTKKAVFDSTLPTLSDVRILVTSVLSNFINDACVGDDFSRDAHREITDHVETLHRYSLTSPSTRIVVAPPLPRSVPDWFLAYLPGFTSFLYHEVSRMGNSNLKFMTPFVAPPSFYESDGIHLNSDAGLSFVHFLVANSDQLFPSSDDVAQVTESTIDVAASLTCLSKSVETLRSDVSRRRLQDNLIFARIKEDRDYEINKAREDRCTISGLKVTSAPPADPKARKDFFKDLVTKLVEEACPDSDGRPVVLDVLVNMRFGRGPPYFEIKLDSVASSLKFRVAASKLAKDQVGSFDGLFISNTVNLSTRIRIDILKLLSKKMSTPTEVCYVQGFSSRPTLHYKMKENVTDASAGQTRRSVTPGTGRSYTFVESVERWGHLLPSHSLVNVRRKASQAFQGCLEQYFVLLSDCSPSSQEENFLTRLTGQSQPPGRNSYRGPRTRRASGRRGASHGFRGSSVLTGSNSWAQYDADSADGPSSSGPSLTTLSLKRGLSDDADVRTPTKRKTESD